MSWKLPLALAVGISLGACAAPQQREIVDISSTYRAADAAPYDVVGNGSIEGQAFLRQAGGGVVTCAGSNVYLMPDIPVSRSYISLAAQGKQPVVDKGLLSQLHPNAFRVAQCDAQGDFEFNDLAPGDWLILTAVSWVVANREQGSFLRGDVSLNSGATERVLLSDQNRI